MTPKRRSGLTVPKGSYGVRFAPGFSKGYISLPLKNRYESLIRAAPFYYCMEGNSTNAALTEEELRNAGASATYIAYYLTARAMGKRTNSTNHAEKVVRQDVNYPGGGFHEALWKAEPRYPNNEQNPYGADTENHDILREAGVYDSYKEEGPLFA